MLGLKIPLTSLQREEIYTFLGGFYIALAWAIYFLTSQHLNFGDINFILTLSFLFVWLSSVIILYLLLAVYYFLVDKIFDNICKNKSKDCFVRILNLKNDVVNYFDYDYMVSIRLIFYNLSDFPAVSA